MTDRLSSKRESSIAGRYRQRSDTFTDRAAELSRRLARIHAARHFLLAIAGLVVLVAITGSLRYQASLPILAALAISWSVCTLLAESCESQLRYAEALGQIKLESLARLARDWEKIPLLLPELPEARRALADDLDLLGKASLFHLLCQAQTPWGIATLRDWLLAERCPKNLADRQRAVFELAPELEFRQEFGARARLIRGKTIDQDELVRWGKTCPKVSLKRLFEAWRIVYPTAAVGFLLLFVAGAISVTAFGTAATFMLLFNFVLTVLFVGPIHDLFRDVLHHGGLVGQYRTLFELLHRSIDGRPSVLTALGAEARSATVSCAALAQLERVAGFARLAKLPAIWLPVQVVTLWDFHVFHAIERWHRQYAAQLPSWLKVLGEFEAILSLAALAHDNPTWCFPRVSENSVVESSAEVFRAEGLAHPLQRTGARVGNDVTLGPRETVLFVTGSNMAGKSTLLRSIGTNVVLAQAGGPVCAKTLKMSPLVLGTVFRVHDSLQHGVSLYMTELLRLKEVVEQARAVEETEGAVFLFLLDEILHGTNTAERHVAARTVILELLRQGASGAVSTHDLDLPKESKLASVSRNVHFSDRLTSDGGVPKLEFDYLLRDGIAQSTNALRFLEVIGLKVEA